MKKEYVKPELSASTERKFERVYAGGCTKVHDRDGCFYNPNGSADMDTSNSNAHKNIDPGNNPDGGYESSN